VVPSPAGQPGVHDIILPSAVGTAPPPSVEGAPSLCPEESDAPKHPPPNTCEGGDDSRVKQALPPGWYGCLTLHSDGCPSGNDMLFVDQLNDTSGHWQIILMISSRCSGTVSFRGDFIWLCHMACLSRRWLGRQERIRVGQMCKALIDHGRLLWLQEHNFKVWVDTEYTGQLCYWQGCCSTYAIPAINASPFGKPCPNCLLATHRRRS
jgi:hypothetical protein